ncbi:MAG: hypothetical protein BGO26_05825 [Actinobacteria bacterium 69-20]|nr:MAG: hypothetical protein BGO26_05825 [Actinobacteria bacterium 69-20]
MVQIDSGGAATRPSPGARNADDGAVIVAEGLTRRFGPRLAVDGLNLTVGRGEVLGVLGPNGAGKTTTIRMLAGLIDITAGRARVAGIEVGDEGSAQRLRSQIGLLPEEPGLYPDLSAVATMEFFARLYGVPKPDRADRIEELLRRLGLWDRRDNTAGTFSKGMRQRLALARALIHQPPVLFLDEPTANLDPEAAADVRRILGELRQAGHTIVINTHQLDEAERLCDRIAILNTRLIATGAPAELRASAETPGVTIELDAVTADVLAAAGTLAAAPITAPITAPDATVATLTVRLADMRRETPALVAAIVAAGGRIQRVSPGEASLEETYLRLIADQHVSHDAAVPAGFAVPAGGAVPNQGAAPTGGKP